MLPVEPLIEKVKRLERRDVAFDVGAGKGYFTVHLARVFRKVYAVEIDFEAAKVLADIKNVGIIISDKPPEVDFEVDFVLFANSLHEIEDIEDYAEWVKSISRSFAVIDWKKDVCTEFGPPKPKRLELEYVLEIFKDFRVEVLDVYRCHFFIFGIK